MGSILSIDYGLKRIGLAISDKSRSFAFPCGVIENKNFKFVLSQIKNIIQAKEIDLIIIGMPYNQRAGIREQKLERQPSMEKIVSGFVRKLKKNLNISFELVDERFSSFAAGENLKESGISAKKSKKFIDAEAARLILQDYLDSSKN